MDNITELRPHSIRCDWDDENFWTVQVIDGAEIRKIYTLEEAAVMYEQLSIMNQPWPRC